MEIRVLWLKYNRIQSCGFFRSLEKEKTEEITGY